MLRGRCIRELSAISYQRTGSKKKAHPSPALRTLTTSHPPLACPPQLQRRRATALVSPIIPVDPRNPPVSPIIPVHTQKQGGGGCFFELSTGHPTKDAHPERAARAEGSLPSFSPNSFVFSHRRYYILNSMNNNIVGAPTYCIWFTTGASIFKVGPPQKDGPYKNCALPTVNCEHDLPNRAFYRGIIKFVGAPTYASCSQQRANPRAQSGVTVPLQLQATWSIVC